MKGFKRFKVFYFSNDRRPHFNEPNRNWELIIARNEDEAEDIFKLLYNKDLSDANLYSIGDLYRKTYCIF